MRIKYLLLLIVLLLVTLIPQSSVLLTAVRDTPAISRPQSAIDYHLEQLNEIKEAKYKVLKEKFKIIAHSTWAIWKLKYFEIKDKNQQQEDKRLKAIGQQQINRTNSFKVAALAITDLINLGIMRLELVYKPQAWEDQESQLAIYEKTELFPITRDQEKQMATVRDLKDREIGTNLKVLVESTGELLAANLAIAVNPLTDASTDRIGYPAQQLQKTLKRLNVVIKDLGDRYQIAAMLMQTEVDLEFEMKMTPSQPPPPVVAQRPPVWAGRLNQNGLSGRMRRVMQWADYIVAAANKYDVDPALVAAIIDQESGGNPSAISPAGAIGLMQLMPGTARGLGVNPFNPVENIEGGTKYIARQLKAFGNIPEALAAYNAGPGRVSRYREIAETSNYVRKVPIKIFQYHDLFQ